MSAPTLPTTDPHARLEFLEGETNRLSEKLVEMDRRIAAARAGADRRIARLQEARDELLRKFGALGYEIDDIAERLDL